MDNDLKKLFFRFLKENNCYEQFMYYIHNREITFLTKSLEEETNNFKSNPINTFAWHMSKEGEGFWNYLYYKWEITLNDYKFSL